MIQIGPDTWQSITWDWFLMPHHRGWARAWAEVNANCDQDGMSWGYMERSPSGRHFRQRTSDGGPNRWYEVAREPDDFELVDGQPYE